MSLQDPSPVSADTATYSLECPTTVREGRFVNVFLIRMTNHTHSQNFEARWEALTGTASEADYTHTTASQTSNDSQTLENRMGRSFPTTTDALIEGAETFTIKARGGETQGEFNSNDDLRCQITIIDLYVTQINMVSTPSSGDIYRIGETIEFSATFNTEVEVEGTVNMGFYIGDQWKGANYRRGSDSDGIAIGANNLRLNSGTIKKGSDNAILTHDAIADNANHKVDGVRPTVSSIAITSDPGDDDTYAIGDSIKVTVTFSEDIAITGEPTLELDFDGTAKTANYLSTGESTAVFAYAVAEGDTDSNGIAIRANRLSLNDGTIKDQAGILRTGPTTP